MTDTTQHDPRARAQASLAEHFNKMQSVFSECVIKPQIDYQNGYITGYLALDEELTRLREQLEVERMRLVACGVVALANTPESAAKNRQMKDEYRSGSLDDVIRIVDSEMALREQVLAQQARIAQMRDGLLHYSDIRPDTLGRTVVLSDEGAIARNALATTDDLSALKAHDDALWNEALTTGIEWQATRGHTLDADDYENELRSLKR